jgi:hypothetical protein
VRKKNKTHTADLGPPQVPEVLVAQFPNWHMALLEQAAPGIPRQNPMTHVEPVMHCTSAEQ